MTEQPSSLTPFERWLLAQPPTCKAWRFDGYSRYDGRDCFRVCGEDCVVNEETQQWECPVCDR